MNFNNMGSLGSVLNGNNGGEEYTKAVNWFNKQNPSELLDLDK